nr:hypothetical protein K-LCC10_0079 [Kaumoebavirus]
MAIRAADGEIYNVQRYPNFREAANNLSKTHQAVIVLLRHLKSKYANTPEWPRVSRLLNNYNPDNIVENNPKNLEGTTSYTDKKGQTFVICLRKREKPTVLHDLNILIFVTVHELGHLMSATYGHNDEFWSNFKFILQNAADIGLYIPEDYSTNNVKYCGLEITYNPIYDKNLRA